MIKESLMFLLFCAFVLVSTVTLVNTFCKYECETRSVSFNHKYSLIGGCMVEVDKRWIPLDNYRYMGD